jgi:hypothetical protein
LKGNSGLSCLDKVLLRQLLKLLQLLLQQEQLLILLRRKRLWLQRLVECGLLLLAIQLVLVLQQLLLLQILLLELLELKLLWVLQLLLLLLQDFVLFLQAVRIGILGLLERRELLGSVQ